LLDPKTLQGSMRYSYVNTTSGVRLVSASTLYQGPLSLLKQDIQFLISW